MTVPIFNKHGNIVQPNTYKRGSQRIDFWFCTPHIEEYRIRYGIIPFDLLTSSGYHGIYLDINIILYLKDSFTNPPILDSRLLTSTNPRAITQYKQELMKCSLNMKLSLM